MICGWGLIIGLILIQCAHADATFNATYNITQLPQYGNVSFNFTLQPNATIYFSGMVNDTHINLTYPNHITLDANHSEAELDLAYYVPYFVDYSGNWTDLESIINVSNDYNNVSVLLFVRFGIYHPPELSNLSNLTNTTTPFMTMEDDGKKIVIYSYSAIEFNRTHRVKVLAPNNATLYVTCGQLLTCPNNVTVIDNNTIEFDNRIYMPENFPPGNYSTYIRVTNGNITGNISIEMRVSGDDVYNVILYDVWNASCYDSVENLADCYKKQARYNAEVANSLLANLRANNLSAICGSNMIANETIKYVEVGNIDPELLDDYNDIRGQYNTLTVRYNTLSDNYRECTDANVAMKNETINIEANLSSEYNDKTEWLYNATMAERERFKERWSYVISGILGTAVVVMTAIILLGLYMRRNWMISYFPTTYLAFVDVFLAIAWAVITFYLGK